MKVWVPGEIIRGIWNQNVAQKCCLPNKLASFSEEVWSSGPERQATPHVLWMKSLGCMCLAEDAVIVSDYPTLPQERDFVYIADRQLYCIIYDPCDCYRYLLHTTYSVGVHCLHDCHFHPSHNASTCLILVPAATNQNKLCVSVKGFRTEGRIDVEPAVLCISGHIWRANVLKLNRNSLYWYIR